MAIFRPIEQPAYPAMRIVILGAGLLGVASAYYLAKDGHQVTVLDRQPEPARETSYANASLLTPNHSFPWAGPGAPLRLLKSLWDPMAGLRLRPHLSAQLMDWGLRFLRHCTSDKFRHNSQAKARLCFYSMAETGRITRETGVTWHRNQRGVLYLFRDKHELDEADHAADLLREVGAEIGPIDWDAVVAIEPALAHGRTKFAGALHGRSDETGDARQFTQQLAQAAQRLGVTFRFNVSIKGFRMAGGKVAAVDTSEGDVAGDTFVLAAGSYSPQIAKTAGLHLPIYPIKGYSLTLPVLDPEQAPQTGGLDEGTLVAFCRLGDKVRLTSVAEVAGYNTDFTPADFVHILRSARELFPYGMHFDRTEYWSCLRPATPDGPPIIGPTPVGNLWINAGQGYLGWTMCCGSARLLADQMAGRKPELDPHPYRYGRH
jgi:D-amino-acid dehydrogenase